MISCSLIEFWVHFWWISFAKISTRYACILLMFDGDTLILVFLEVCLFPILTYSLSTIMAALHSSSESLNMSVMSISVLTVAQLSSGMRFPSGLKSISFDVGSILVDAFIDMWSIDDIEHIEDAFHGYADSEAQFAEELVNDCYYGNEQPYWVVTDWQATWDSALRFDYDFDHDTKIVWRTAW